jgi:uncharacterized protein
VLGSRLSKEQTVNLYDLTVPQFINILGQVHQWLDKAKAFAEQKKFDPNILVNARLAPDQFALARQIQSISDQSKFISARLAEAKPPAFEDNEKTIDELIARVDKTVEWLKTLKPEQFQGAAERTITLSFLPGKGIKGVDYAFAMGLPNFYFHATTAYAILRHNGVDLGKRDFLGNVPIFDLETSSKS